MKLFNWHKKLSKGGNSRTTMPGGINNEREKVLKYLRDSIRQCVNFLDIVNSNSL